MSCPQTANEIRRFGVPVWDRDHWRQEWEDADARRITAKSEAQALEAQLAAAQMWKRLYRQTLRGGT